MPMAIMALAMGGTRLGVENCEKCTQLRGWQVLSEDFFACQAIFIYGFLVTTFFACLLVNFRKPISITIHVFLLFLGSADMVLGHGRIRCTLRLCLDCLRIL